MQSAWTSRRRVEVALAHQEPDRVPLSMTITEVPYRRLREYLGLPPDENIQANRFGEVSPGLDLLKALGIDISVVKLRAPANWSPPPPRPDVIIFDEWGVGYSRISLPGGGSLLEATHSPFKGLDPSEIDLAAYIWPDPHDPGRVEGLEEEARRLYEESDLALMGRFGGTIMEVATFLRGYEQWLMDLRRYPDFACDLMNRIADIQIALDEVGIRAAGKYLTIFKVSGEDLGMQNRPMFSPLTWQHILRPILKRRWQAARASLNRYGAAHVKLMLHSDGAIRDFIPDLIEDGIEVLDPIQIRCPGMEPAGLKRDFGKQVTFHGAIDTQYILPFGTPEEVKAETIRCIQALGTEGGFILGPCHNVQPDVPPENLASMFRAAQESEHYPLKGY